MAKRIWRHLRQGFLTLDQFYRLENQSEEKINKIREPAAAVARKLLGS